jgi:hypothetical protein
MCRTRGWDEHGCGDGPAVGLPAAHHAVPRGARQQNHPHTLWIWRGIRGAFRHLQLYRRLSGWVYITGLQRDVVYLSWTSYMGGGGGCGVSANENSCAHHVTWSPNKLWRSNSICNLWCTCTLKRNLNLCVPRKGIARPQSQFPHSCVRERILYSHVRPTYFLEAE